jgi:hypothetical protein
MQHAWGKKRGSVLMGKLESRRPLEKLRCRWENSIKMDI